MCLEELSSSVSEPGTNCVILSWGGLWLGVLVGITREHGLAVEGFSTGSGSDTERVSHVVVSWHCDFYLYVSFERFFCCSIVLEMLTFMLVFKNWRKNS